MNEEPCSETLNLGDAKYTLSNSVSLHWSCLEEFKHMGLYGFKFSQRFPLCGLGPMCAMGGGAWQLKLQKRSFLTYWHVIDLILVHIRKNVCLYAFAYAYVSPYRQSSVSKYMCMPLNNKYNCIYIYMCVWVCVCVHRDPWAYQGSRWTLSVANIFGETFKVQKTRWVRSIYFSKTWQSFTWWP